MISIANLITDLRELDRRLSASRPGQVIDVTNFDWQLVLMAIEEYRKCQT